jgi:hypothetical protein
MTVEEFKKDNPMLSHLEGNDLWDAMAVSLLHQQAGEEIIKTILPFWKRYQLRWLFYRKGKYSILSSEWQTSEVCKNCGRGSNSAMAFQRKLFCLGCGTELIKVPNKRLKYRLWLIWKVIDKKLEFLLNHTHILRKRNEYRYGVFGDESRYCYQTFNINGGDFKNVQRPRKWFEYIFIKK